MNQNKEVLSIRINISKNISDIISVGERDEPEILAQRFCYKHKLSLKSIKAIAHIIEINLDNLIDEELNLQSNSDKSGITTKNLSAKQKKFKEIGKKLPRAGNYHSLVRPATTKALKKFSIQFPESKFSGKIKESHKLTDANNFHEISVEENSKATKVDRDVNLLDFKYRPLSAYQQFTDYSCSLLKQSSAKIKKKDIIIS